MMKYPNLYPHADPLEDDENDDLNGVMTDDSERKPTLTESKNKN